MKISFMIRNFYRMGGTIRSTAILADELARRGHDVEIVGVNRTSDKPHFAISRKVRTRSLVDLRMPGDARRPAFADHESEFVSRCEGGPPVYSRYTDERLTSALESLRSDVLITTRTWLNIAAARFCSDRILRIGQEHMAFRQIRPEQHEGIGRWYPQLDAITCLTAGDREDIQGIMGGESASRVMVMPNGLEPGVKPRSRQENRIITGMGRMVRFKRYDRLIQAFAIAVEKRPDWRLRLYGTGSQAEELRRLTRKLCIADKVVFMGAVQDSYGEMAKASIHALSSACEGFGMTITEAFSCGVPVVSFDSPRGPGEIITNGYDGLLVPNGDIDGLGAALLRLMDDDQERRMMASNALVSAAKYDIRQVADHWEGWLAQLRAGSV